MAQQCEENGLEIRPSEDNDYEQRPKCFSSTFQECLFVVTATMAIGQQSFFQGCIIAVTASIGKRLKMSSAEITWISAGASLSSGAFLLTFGKLADMFGRKALFIGGMSGFTLSLLVAGFATDAIYMDVFSGILGLFAAAVVPPAVGTLGAVYEKPSKRKNRAFACFSAGNPLGFVGGMIISGIASYVSNWRASFWALAVIYALFTGLTVWTVPPDGFARRPVSMDALKKFDFLGTVLVIVGFALFSSSLSMAGDAPDGWKTAYILALFLVGFFLFVGFLYHESIFKDPLMPLQVWKDRNFALQIKHLNALEITLRLLSMVASGVLVNLVCGLVLHRVSNKLLTGIGALAYTAAFLILSFMKEDAIYWEFIFPALVLMVLGADIQFNVTNMYVMSSLPPSEQSIAGGIFNTINRLSNNLGLGIATSVESAIAKQMTSSTPPIHPYLTVYWFAAAAAGLSLLMVPFLTLDTQGGTASQNTESVTGEESAGKNVAVIDLVDSVAAATGSEISPATDLVELERR